MYHHFHLTRLIEGCTLSNSQTSKDIHELNFKAHATCLFNWSTRTSRMYNNHQIRLAWMRVVLQLSAGPQLHMLTLVRNHSQLRSGRLPINDAKNHWGTYVKNSNSLFEFQNMANSGMQHVQLWSGRLPIKEAKNHWSPYLGSEHGQLWACNQTQLKWGPLHIKDAKNQWGTYLEIQTRSSRFGT